MNDGVSRKLLRQPQICRVGVFTKAFVDDYSFMFAAIVFETCSRIPVGLPQQAAKSSFAMSLAANKAAVETAMDLKQL